jgi:hypothetical protein
MTIFARDDGGATIQAIYPGVTQKIDLSATSAQSAPVGTSTTAIRLYATADCFIAIGADPAAAADGTSLPLKAGAAEYFAIGRGQKVAGIVASGTGELYVTEGANH